MEKQDYIDILQRKKSINFIGLAITPWHILGIESTIDILLKDGINLQGDIFVYNHNNTGRCVNENSLKNIPSSINITYDSFPKENNKRKLANFFGVIKYIFLDTRNSEPYYILCPAKPSWMWIDVVLEAYGPKKIMFYIVDEGVGSLKFQTFKGLYESNFEEIYVSKIKRIKYAVQSFFELIFSKFFITILKKRGQYHDNELLIKNGNEVLVNKKVIHSYRNVLFNRAKYIKKNASYHNSIVLNPQLLNDDNPTTEALYKQCIEVGKKNDVNVIIKPHPRDLNISRFETLGCFVEKRKDISQEEILASLEIKPMCIIGFDTTTLITSKILFDIPTISSAKIEMNNTSNTNGDLDYFVNIAKGIVLFPENEDEFIKLLSVIVKNGKEKRK